MKNIVQIGYIGLGRRGFNMLKNFIDMKDVHVKSICDLKEDAISAALPLFDERGLARPKTTTDYHELLCDPEIDAIVIMNSWGTHASLARESVLAGKYTAVEVGCAYTLTECYQLIEAYETTKAPLMMLENCCYDRREMMALNMVKKGLFGEIVHCKGGYHHYLNDCELFKTNEETGKVDVEHYRVRDYIHRNCEQYPTHEFGPISKVLGINRGNRMLTLSSFASKARGLKTYMEDHVDSSHPLYHAEVRQGDIITTVITCANGETVMLELDTTVPRPYYSRNFTVRGTKGMCSEERKTFYLEGMGEEIENNEKEFFEKYDHPLYKEYSQMQARGGHGGMDWLVIRAFVESVKRGIQTPIDAYDTAAWMAIAPLSEMSIAKGGMPVDVPDFTNGKWFCREPLDTGKYCLDEICEEPETPIVP